MEKLNIAIKLLLLFVLLAFVFSAGVYFLYAKAFLYVLGSGLIISTLMIVLFLIVAGKEK